MSVVRSNAHQKRSQGPSPQGFPPHAWVDARCRVRKDPNDRAEFETRRGQDRCRLRSIINLSSLPNLSCHISIKVVAFKLCPCVPHPVGCDARLDGRCAGRLFHRFNNDRRSCINCIWKIKRINTQFEQCEFYDDCN